MGHPEPTGSEFNHPEGPGIYQQIFAQNTGRCVEEAPGEVGLHLGSGKFRWQGWINVDLSDSADLRADLRKLPLPDGYADVACAIHVLEHFYEWEAKPLLLEWKRVLKPGGKLVLELPCMDKVITHIAKSMSKGKSLSKTFSWHVFWGDPKYRDEFMCHKWGYTYAMLRDLVTECGFVDHRFEDPRYHFKERDMRIVCYVV